MLALSPAVPVMCPTLFSTVADGLAVEVGCSTFNDSRVMAVIVGPGLKEPPQDTGRYGYRLVEVLSRRAVE